MRPCYLGFVMDGTVVFSSMITPSHFSYEIGIPFVMKQFEVEYHTHTIQRVLRLRLRWSRRRRSSIWWAVPFHCRSRGIRRAHRRHRRHVGIHCNWYLESTYVMLKRAVCSYRSGKSCTGTGLIKHRCDDRVLERDRRCPSARLLMWT